MPFFSLFVYLIVSILVKKPFSFSHFTTKNGKYSSVNAGDKIDGLNRSEVPFLMLLNEAITLSL